MRITIEVPDSIAQEAAALGVAANTYAEQLLVRTREERSEEGFRRRELDAEAFVRELSKYSEDMPVLPESAFARENIYADHE